MSKTTNRSNPPSTLPDDSSGLLIGGVLLVLAFIGAKHLFSDEKPQPEHRYAKRFWSDLEADAEEVFKQ